MAVVGGVDADCRTSKKQVKVEERLPIIERKKRKERKKAQCQDCTL